MKLVVLLALVAYAYGDCPAFGAWREQTDCLWLKGDDGKVSAKNLRDGFINACGITINGNLDDLPDLPIDVQVPDKCGYCSFKVKCRNRDGMDQGCFPIDAEKETCNQHSDVCIMPKVPKLDTCHWGMVGALLSQCASGRPDVPEWKRKGFRDVSEFFPSQNCIKKGDECACCCHPYKPNADGTECVAVPPKPECNDFGEFGPWTDCLWFEGNLKNVFKEVKNHCFPGETHNHEDTKTPADEDLKVTLPGGFEMPARCGFCSFKVRCKKRDANGKRGCFPVKADKQACGPDDCETCGNVCDLPKMSDVFRGDLSPCQWQKKMMTMMKARVKKWMSKIKNYWRKRGFLQILKYMPFGSCKEVGDKCKCCCHPYEPSDDGTQCVVKDVCKMPADLGMTWSVTTS